MNRIPFNRSESSIVLVYSNGEQWHVNGGFIEEDLLEYNEACQVTTFAYTTGKIGSRIKAKGIHADTRKTETFIIDAYKSGLAFVVAAPCASGYEDNLCTAKVYTCSGIKDWIGGDDISFVADTLANGI